MLTLRVYAIDNPHYNQSELLDNLYYTCEKPWIYWDLVSKNSSYNHSGQTFWEYEGKAFNKMQDLNSVIKVLKYLNINFRFENYSGNLKFVKS